MTLQPPAPPLVTVAAGPPGPIRARLALPMAVLAGAALLLALPPYDLWWLTPVGVGLLGAVAHRRRLRAGFGFGLVAGLVLFVPLLDWTSLAAGWLPWALLSASQAAYVGLIGLACAWLAPLVDRWRALWPPLLGLLWVTQEAMRDRAPFGGFPWGRLAFSQGDAPSLRLAVWGGAPLVAFAAAAAGAALLALGWHLAEWRAALRGSPNGSTPPASALPGSALPASALPASALPGSNPAGSALPGSNVPGSVFPGSHLPGADPSGPASPRPIPRGSALRCVRLLPALGFAALGALLIAGPLLVRVGAPGAETRTVAIVQGNVPRLGLDFNAQRRAVLDNHASATLRLAADVKAGKAKQPDLVVWPENSSDIDPLINADASREITAAADAIGAPILVGAVLRTDKPADIKNAGILWLPRTGADLSQVYVKQHPVPFAEYMPLRSVARLVSDKTDLVKNMLAGDHPGVIRAGPLTLGDVICFEVAYDGLVRDTVTGGAQILVVQTNNATFNEAEARQQLAMVRLRAVEHGREGLMSSTVGVSGYVGTAGDVHDSSGFNVDSVMVRDMHLGGSRTLATRLGHWPEVAAVVLTVIALAGVLPLRRRRRTTSKDGERNAEAR